MKPDLFWFVKFLTSTDGAGGLEKDTVNFVASLETALNVIPEKKQRRLNYHHSSFFQKKNKLSSIIILCTILIITRINCPEQQGAVVNLDSRL